MIIIDMKPDSQESGPSESRNLMNREKQKLGRNLGVTAMGGVTSERIDISAVAKRLGVRPGLRSFSCKCEPLSESACT